MRLGDIKTLGLQSFEMKRDSRGHLALCLFSVRVLVIRALVLSLHSCFLCGRADPNFVTP